MQHFYLAFRDGNLLLYDRRGMCWSISAASHANDVLFWLLSAVAESARHELDPYSKKAVIPDLEKASSDEELLDWLWNLPSEEVVGTVLSVLVKVLKPKPQQPVPVYSRALLFVRVCV